MPVGPEHLGEPGLHLRPGDRIERGERLVEQEDRPPRHQCAKECDPLAHPAGELVRAGVLEALQSEPVEVLRRLSARSCPRQPADPKSQGCVVERGEPGEEEIPLRHVRATREPLARFGVAGDRDGPGARRPQPRDQLQQRGLAATRRADDPHDLAGLDVEVDALDRAQLSEGVAELADAERRTPDRLGGMGPRGAHAALVGRVRSAFAKSRQHAPSARITAQVQRVSGGVIYVGSAISART